MLCRSGVGSDDFLSLPDTARGTGVRMMGVSMDRGVVTDRGSPLTCEEDTGVMDSVGARLRAVGALAVLGPLSSEDSDGVDAFVEDGAEGFCCSLRLGRDGFGWMAVPLQNTSNTLGPGPGPTALDGLARLELPVRLEVALDEDIGQPVHRDCCVKVGVLGRVEDVHESVGNAAGLGNALAALRRWCAGSTPCHGWRVGARAARLG